LGGRSVISPELLSFWQHRRDELAPATEASFREAAQRVPYSEALAAAARGHLAVLAGRQSRGEGAEGLAAALKAYDDAYVALRQSAVDSQQIAIQAQARLDSLEREKANSVVGGDQVKGFIASVLAADSDLPVNVETGVPLTPAAGGAGQSGVM
jgi:hypothetical protein